MRPAFRPLELDFCRVRRSAPWIRPLLAVLALALAADAGVSYQRTRAAVFAAEQRIAELGGKAVRTDNAPQTSGEEFAAAREVYERLAIPWEDLFRAIESTTNDRIALVGVEPDPKSGAILISGEAADYLAVVSYVLNLVRGGALKHAHLVKHELRPGRNDRSVAFTISASFKEQP